MGLRFSSPRAVAFDAQISRPRALRRREQMKTLEHQRAVEQRHRGRRIDGQRSLDRVQGAQIRPDGLIALAKLQLNDREVIQDRRILGRQRGELARATAPLRPEPVFTESRRRSESSAASRSASTDESESRRCFASRDAAESRANVRLALGGGVHVNPADESARAHARQFAAPASRPIAKRSPRISRVMRDERVAPFADSVAAADHRGQPETDRQQNTVSRETPNAATSRQSDGFLQVRELREAR